MRTPCLPSLAFIFGLCGSAGAAPPLPETPAPVLRLVAARPFLAREPIGYSWDRSQQPSLRGWLLVVQADPGLVAVRQLAEPNLIAGDHLAVRAGRASRDGMALYLLPADVDLAAEPLFFGEPKLPESLSADDVQQQADLAREKHLPALSADDIATALAAGGAEVSITSFADLGAAMADLRARFIAPAEGSRP